MAAPMILVVMVPVVVEVPDVWMNFDLDVVVIVITAVCVPAVAFVVAHDVRLRRPNGEGHEAHTHRQRQGEF